MSYASDRIEIWLEHWPLYDRTIAGLRVRDVRKVIAQAKSASDLRAKNADLRRRLRLAARKLDAWCADKDPGGLVEAAMLLDRRYSLPRKPLPRGRR